MISFKFNNPIKHPNTNHHRLKLHNKDNYASIQSGENFKFPLINQAFFPNINFRGQMQKDIYTPDYFKSNNLAVNKISDDVKLFISDLKSFLKDTNNGERIELAKKQSLSNSYDNLFINLLDDEENKKYSKTDYVYIYSSILEMLDKSKTSESAERFYNIISDFSNSFGEKSEIIDAKRFYSKQKKLTRSELLSFLAE